MAQLTKYCNIMFDAIKPIPMTFEGVPCVVIRARQTATAFDLMVRITGTKSAQHHRGKIIWINYRDALDDKTKTPIFKAVWKAAMKKAPQPN